MDQITADNSRLQTAGSDISRHQHDQTAGQHGEQQQETRKALAGVFQ
jgi:hypothetical protein